MSTTFLTLYRSQWRALFGEVVRIVRDNQVAEDLTQEAFLRVRGPIEAGEVAHAEAYVHRTARNLAVDYQRKRTARGRVEVDSFSDAHRDNIAGSAPAIDTVVLQRERLRQFRRALKTLPKRAQRVLILSRLENWSNVRIAAELGVSERTVFNDLRLALGHCSDAMKRLE